MSSYHPRINPANYPLLQRYPVHHLAVQTLQVHAESRDICVGKEIEWPQLGEAAIEQSWYSKVRQKPLAFSTFAYEYLSYDLVLDGWLEMTPEPTESEIGFLCEGHPAMNSLLDECEHAAVADKNSGIMPLVSKSREFVSIYYDALLQRFSECDIAWPCKSS